MDEKVISKPSEQMLQFLSRTNTSDVEVAAGWLEATNDNVEEAVELFMQADSMQVGDEPSPPPTTIIPFRETAEFDMYRTLATHKSPPLATESISILIKLFENIVHNPQEEKLQTIRLNNPKIAKALKDARGVMPYMFRLGWIQEHLSSGEMNESVLRFKGAIGPLRDHVNYLNMLMVEMSSISLPILLKVGLPSGTPGTELWGAFDAMETIADLRYWVRRVRMDPGGTHLETPQLGLSENPSLELSDVECIGAANLHQKKLIVKKVGTADEARAKLQQQAQEERMRYARERERTVMKARQVTLEKRANKQEVEKSRVKNIQRFDEDRLEAEERARRVVAKVAKGKDG